MKKLYNIIEEHGGIGCSLYFNEQRRNSFVGTKQHGQNEWSVDVIEIDYTSDIYNPTKTLVMKTDVDGAIKYIKNNFKTL